MNPVDVRRDVHATGVDDTELAPAILEARNVSKRFGSVQALERASMEIRPGEVHALIGENGSGKSTLLGLLTGQLSPDSGSLHLNDQQVRFESPGDALRRGIAIVTQELSVVSTLSVAENVYLGQRKQRRALGISWSKIRRDAIAELAKLDAHIDPDAIVGRLPIDAQQVVEITRALASDARIIILDEPTSSLSGRAVEELLARVKRLASEGVAVVIVTHRLEELFEVSDRVTVLRDGVSVVSEAIGDVTRADIVRKMLGHEPQPFDTKRSTTEHRPLISVDRLRAGRTVEAATFDVCPGEIVGLVGLIGSGRTELLQALFGLIPVASGTSTFSGVAKVSSAREAMRAGIGYVPPDRKAVGLVLGMSVNDNVQIAPSSKTGRWRHIPRRAERASSELRVKKLAIKCGSVGVPVSTLSGGNQQKVLLGRWLETNPRLLLLDEPTRGVDIGARDEIHQLLLAGRNDGMAIVVSSSDIEELLALCDRFVVMYRGKTLGSIDRASANEARLAHLASGGDG